MNKLKEILKKILVTTGIIVGACVIGFIILVSVSMHQSKQRTTELASMTPAPYVMPELDFVVEDSDEPLEVDTYEEYRWAKGTTNLYIYDSDYLDLFFDYPCVTAEETKRIVAENDLITPKFKVLLYWYIDTIAEKYPDADLRILHYNLQTLEVVECDSHDLIWHTMSFDSYGCYVKTENKIYVNTDYEYKPGTWEYQVIIHEFSHAARTIVRHLDSGSVRIQLCKEYMEIPEEALNSLFAVSLFDYEELDIAYQLPSNLFMIMLECLDDYDLCDYINHGLTYLAHKLDEQNGNNNYAVSIFKLIGELRTDALDDHYEREQKVYYPIYDYVCKMYLDKYASADMSDEEIHELVQGLIERVLYDVPEEYHVDTEEFFRFANGYMTKMIAFAN